MKTHRLLVLLTIANLGLLVALIAQGLVTRAEAQGGTLLRGRALEIVDTAGRVRASIGLLPSQPGLNGEPPTETVILRLINSAGQPSVKIGTSETGAGLSFVGGDDRSYLVLGADDAEVTLKMVEPGRQQIISP